MITYLITDTEADALAWIARIDAANGWPDRAGSVTWAVPRQMVDGRWAFPHPWGPRFVTPFGAPPPVPLSREDFPQSEDP